MTDKLELPDLNILKKAEEAAQIVGAASAQLPANLVHKAKADAIARVVAEEVLHKAR